MRQAICETLHQVTGNYVFKYPIAFLPVKGGPPGESKNGIAPAAAKVVSYRRIRRNRRTERSREENANGRPATPLPSSGRPRPCFRNREPDHRSIEERLPGETVRGDVGIAGRCLLYTSDA